MSRGYSVSIDGLSDLQINIFALCCLGFQVSRVERIENDDGFDHEIYIRNGSEEKLLIPLDAPNLALGTVYMTKMSLVHDDVDNMWTFGNDLHSRALPTSGLSYLEGKSIVTEASLIKGIYRCLIKRCADSEVIRYYHDKDLGHEVPIPILRYIYDRSKYSFV